VTWANREEKPPKKCWRCRSEPASTLAALAALFVRGQKFLHPAPPKLLSLDPFCAPPDEARSERLSLVRFSPSRSVEPTLSVTEHALKGQNPFKMGVFPLDASLLRKKSFETALRDLLHQVPNLLIMAPIDGPAVAGLRTWIIFRFPPTRTPGRGPDEACPGCIGSPVFRRLFHRDEAARIRAHCEGFGSGGRARSFGIRKVLRDAWGRTSFLDII